MTDRTRRRCFIDHDRPRTGAHALTTGHDEHGLPILATDTVGDRTVRFSLVVGQPRLRLTFTDHDPTLLGHVTGLDRDRPRLIVAEPLHLSWAFTHADPIEHCAQTIWNTRIHHCDR